MNLDRVWALARRLHLEREALTCQHRGCNRVGCWQNKRTCRRTCFTHMRGDCKQILLCEVEGCESRARVRNIRTGRQTCERHAKGKTESIE